MSVPSRIKIITMITQPIKNVLNKNKQPPVEIIHATP